MQAPNVSEEAKERARRHFTLLKQFQWEVANGKPYWKRGLDEEAARLLVECKAIKNPDRRVTQADIDSLPEPTEEELLFLEYLERLSQENR